VLEDHKIAIAGVDRPRVRRQVARLRRFQRGLARAFAWPVHAIQTLDDSVTVCRCEGISAGELRASIRAKFGPSEVNRLKAITRCGMGRCQGRFCALAGAELTAHELSLPLEAVGRLRAQPPVKPLPLSVTLAENAAAATRDETNAPM
jgi:bacterioferritin-associated ferredoxin